MTLPNDAVIFVDLAQHVADYQLHLFFNDGTDRIVDFGPFLRHSRNPQIQSYLDPARFSQFRVESGDLLWGDYDLCFPIADLYDGNL